MRHQHAEGHLIGIPKLPKGRTASDLGVISQLAPPDPTTLMIHCTTHDLLHFARNRKAVEGRKLQRTWESLLSLSGRRVPERVAQAVQPNHPARGIRLLLMLYMGCKSFLRKYKAKH